MHGESFAVGQKREVGELFGVLMWRAAYGGRV